MTTTWLSTGVAVALALGVAACGTARRSEPVSGPVPLLNAEQQRGEIAFMRNCNSCHPGGEAGLGGSLNDKPFPGNAIKAKVRTSLGFGDMPQFTEQAISERELEDIVNYMAALRAMKANADPAKK